MSSHCASTSGSGVMRSSCRRYRGIGLAWSLALGQRIAGYTMTRAVRIWSQRDNHRAK